MLLLGAVARRLTGTGECRLSGHRYCGAASCGLAPVMCWTSIYNQALCAFFLLLAFYCLLRYQDSGAFNAGGWRSGPPSCWGSGRSKRTWSTRP